SRVPGDVRVLDAVRIGERPDASRHPAINAAKARTLLVLIKRMAASASPLEKRLTAIFIDGSCYFREQTKTGQRESKRDYAGPPTAYQRVVTDVILLRFTVLIPHVLFFSVPGN